MPADFNPDLLDTFDADFSELEQAITDPIITDAFKEVDEFNELLKTEVTTLEDAQTIAAMLNAMWESLISKEMTVSGMVTFKNPDGEDFTEYYDEERMISNGFFVQNDGTSDYTQPQTGRRVKLQFYMPIPEDQKEAYGRVTESSHLVGLASTDQVRLTLDGISLERAKAWLNATVPDLIERIDVCILNTDGSPGEVIEALQGVDLTNDLDEPDASFATECLGVYISSIVDFDSKLPYLAEIRGKIIIQDPEGNPVYARLTGAAEYLIYIHDVVALGVSETDTATNETATSSTNIYLQSTVMNNVHEGVDLPARIPVDSINHFESIRPLVSSLRPLE